MVDEQSTLKSRAGCWRPFIVVLDFFMALPGALWLLDKDRYPWNVAVLAVMLIAMVGYFLDSRRKKRVDPKGQLRP